MIAVHQPSPYDCPPLPESYGTIKEILIESIDPRKKHIRQDEIDSITEKSLLVSGLGFDSLDLLEVKMELGEEFDLVIDDIDWKEVRTIEDLVRFIEYEIFFQDDFED